MREDGINLFDACYSAYGGSIGLWAVKVTNMGGNNVFQNCKSREYGGCIFAYQAKNLIIDQSNLFDKVIYVLQFYVLIAIAPEFFCKKVANIEFSV